MTSSASFSTDRAALDASKIVDLEFPYAGASIWHPYGYQLAQTILDQAAHLIEAQGFEELGLPSLIPVHVFQRQAEEIKDFLARTYLATPVPDQDFVLKPTIEAQISVFMATRAHAGSLRYYTRRGVARYERGKTFPLWKERIVWPFFEAHAAVPRSAVNDEIARLIDFSYQFARTIGLPILMIERLNVDGARHLAYAHRRLEAVHVLRDGRVTALTSIYDLGDRFSRAFNVRAADGSFLDMVNFAYSGRMVLALLTYLSGIAGWTFPAAIAPQRVALIVLRQDAQGHEHARRLAAMLAANAIPAEIIVARRKAMGLEQAAQMGLAVQLVVTCAADQVEVKLVAAGEENGVAIDAASLVAAVADRLAKNTRRLATLYNSYHATVLHSAISEANAHTLLQQKRAVVMAVCDGERCIGALDAMAHQASVDLIGQLVRVPQHGTSCGICQQVAVKEILVAERFSQEK